MPVPLTPAEQRDKLLNKLTTRQPTVAKTENYFNGLHPLAFATSKFRAAFGEQLRAFASNWGPLVVDSIVERLEITGFEYEGKKDIEDRALDIWYANGLDTESDIAHSEACKHGTAYILVDPTASPEDDSESPLITIEHPLEVITTHAPGQRRLITAGLKSWKDDDDFYWCNLYLPNIVYKWWSAKPVKGNNKPRWEPYDAVNNPLHCVPLVPLENNPTLLGGGVSDLRDVIPLNDGINKLMCDLLVASEFYAFAQRVFIGVDDAEDEEGNPIPFELPAHLAQGMTLPEGADIKVLTAQSLEPYTGAIEQFLRQVAAITRTPPNYLLGQMVNLSGEALIAAEKGHTNKAKRKQRNFKHGWLRAMNLALQAKGIKAPLRGNVAWTNPESLTPAQLADPLVKLREGLNIPYEVLWRMYGFSPQQVDDMRGTMGLPINGTPSPKPDVTSPVTPTPPTENTVAN